MRILLVEPDKLEAAAYARALRQDGHEVIHAVSAQEGVRAADTSQLDLVILELQLPRHNGIEFLYEFRSYHEWLAIPVLLHTFVPRRELAETSTLTRELGVVRCLYKPETSLAQLCAAARMAVPASAT